MLLKSMLYSIINNVEISTQKAQFKKWLVKWTQLKFFSKINFLQASPAVDGHTKQRTTSSAYSNQKHTQHTKEIVSVDYLVNIVETPVDCPARTVGNNSSFTTTTEAGQWTKLHTDWCYPTTIINDALLMRQKKARRASLLQSTSRRPITRRRRWRREDWRSVRAVSTIIITVQEFEWGRWGSWRVGGVLLLPPAAAVCVSARQEGGEWTASQEQVN